MGTESRQRAALAEHPLRRWSRRKHEARLVPEPEQARAPVAEEPTAAEATTKTDADMPALETLHGWSDVSDFFAAGVSEELRHTALRHLFSHARFNVTDGLDDYAGNYTRYTTLGDLVTAGLRRHRERIEGFAAAARGPESVSGGSNETTPERTTAPDAGHAPGGGDHEPEAQS